ncbi:uncharacterized protein LOC127122757 [Lathyrus oleraceus]|uniref:uncharacterized protein LOC127122757 n=1 Tax=Pisum sativum TaxID=3888 RepID=UPI0021D075AE|nr:uncharacterized protein LOC127122757 [Pisum sativum]
MTSWHSYNARANQKIIMDQLEQNQDALKEEMTHMRAQIGQLMEVIQNVARGQEENLQTNQRATVVDPIVNPAVGNGVPVVSQPPPEGIPINRNTANTFHISSQGGSQADVDDHNETFFMPKAQSMYDAYKPSPTDIDMKLHLMEERFKEIEGPSTFGLDAADMCLVPGVKIPTKFKVPRFEKYKGITYPKTHIRSFCRKMAAYSDDKKLSMHFYQDSLSGALLEWYMQLERMHVHTWRGLDEAFLKQY